MKKYRKKPVVIEALQYESVDDINKIVNWIRGEGVGIQSKAFRISATRISIPTLEGDMIAQPGDWVIKGVEGEFYPCKPDIFEKTYEPMVTITYTNN